MRRTLCFMTFLRAFLSTYKLGQEYQRVRTHSWLQSAIAYWHSNSGSLSICLSVTRLHYVKKTIKEKYAIVHAIFGKICRVASPLGSRSTSTHYEQICRPIPSLLYGICIVGFHCQQILYESTQNKQPRWSKKLSVFYISVIVSHSEVQHQKCANNLAVITLVELPAALYKYRIVRVYRNYCHMNH